VRAVSTYKFKDPSLWLDIAYAVVTLSSRFLWAYVSGWLVYFYLPPDGQVLVPIAFYGAIVLVSSLLQAFAEPIIGYWSDHLRNAWGRRLPFMAIASLPMLVLFVLLWVPPVSGFSVWNLVYLGLILSLYKIFVSLQQIPYRALLPELATSDSHRVRISSWFSGFELLGMVLGSCVGFLIDQVGYTHSALICAVSSLPFLYLPLFFLKESPDRQIAHSKQLSLRQSFVEVLRNRAFLNFVVTRSLGWGAITLIQISMPFIVTEICQLSRAHTPYFYIPAIIVSLLCYPLVTRLAKSIDKRYLFAGSMLASAIILPGLWIINPRWSVSLLVQGIIWTVMQAVAMSGFSVLQGAFIAQITTNAGVSSGQYREGAYLAVWALLSRIVSGFAELLFSLLLLLGANYLSTQSSIGVRFVGLSGGFLMLAGFLIFRFRQFPSFRTYRNRLVEVTDGP
jgi:Na+/melibiose symporter-like transporter